MGGPAATNSTLRQAQRPGKPRPDFPLTDHGNGQWCKKIKSLVRFFGVWAHPDGAVALYEQERAAWEPGQNPWSRDTTAARPQAVQLWELADRWLVYQRDLIDAPDHAERITPSTYGGSRHAMEHLLEATGKRVDPLSWSPQDFARLRVRLGAGVSPATKGQRVMYVRAMFDWARDSRLIPALPDYGRDFENVSAGEKEEYRYDFQKAHGERRFELEEARAILQACDAAALRRAGNWGSRAETMMLVGSRCCACATTSPRTPAATRRTSPASSCRRRLGRGVPRTQAVENARAVAGNALAGNRGGNPGVPGGPA